MPERRSRAPTSQDGRDLLGAHDRRAIPVPDPRRVAGTRPGGRRDRRVELIPLLARNGPRGAPSIGSGGRGGPGRAHALDAAPAGRRRGARLVREHVPAAGSDEHVHRSPYLTRVTLTEADFAWKAKAGSGGVEVSLLAPDGTSRRAGDGRFRGLRPGTRYTWSANVAGRSAAAGAFSTAPRPPRPRSRSSRSGTTVREARTSTRSAVWRQRAHRRSSCRPGTTRTCSRPRRCSTARSSIHCAHCSPRHRWSPRSASTTSRGMMEAP